MHTAQIRFLGTFIIISNKVNNECETNITIDLGIVLQIHHLYEENV